MPVPTPLSWAARRWSLSHRALRWSSTAALIVSIVIILTGGLVRITGSGLGCSNWPMCTDESLIATRELGIHGAIEFGNRMMTTVLIVAVAWVIIAARLQRPWDRSVTRLAWSQFWLVVVNAVLGGITVWVELNPFIVAVHFLAAIALLTTTAFTWHRVRERRPAVYAPTRGTRAVSIVLVIVTALLVVLGTATTGSGPHSGDSSDVPRMPFDWTIVTVMHGVLGTGTLVAGIILWVMLARQGAAAAVPRRRATAFVAITIAQALVGVVQALAHLPEWLVAIHLLGSALVWVGLLRVLLDVNPGLFSAAEAGRARRPEDETMAVDLNRWEKGASAASSHR
ncbi:MAG: COX15/CtaA family protein [Microbacterium sp.]